MSAHGKDTRTAIPRTIRALAVPIILIWVAFTAATNLLVPQVEKVGMANAVSMSPQDAPAVIAAKRMGEKFQESTSDSIAMVVLVGDEPLGESAREYYRTLVGKFKADTKHVQHVQDFWGDMITAAGVQSSAPSQPSRSIRTRPLTLTRRCAACEAARSRLTSLIASPSWQRPSVVPATMCSGWMSVGSAAAMRAGRWSSA